MTTEMTELPTEGLNLMLALMERNAIDLANTVNGLQDGLVRDGRDLGNALLIARGALEAIFKVAELHEDEKIAQIAAEALYRTDERHHLAQIAAERNWDQHD